MENLLLTIQSCGGNKNKFRFGIPIKESQLILSRKTIITFEIEGKRFTTKTTCGQWIDMNGNLKFTKGFDLYSKEISDYIIENKLHIYPIYKPNRLNVNIISIK